MATISKFERRKEPPKRKRVAAYARVSVNTDETRNSLLNQVDAYSKFIKSNPEWIFAGVYADLGISGTGMDKRDEFERMLSDCKKGLIDVILVKSISRFARNTVDLLQTVRYLRSLNIEVRFERESIHTLSSEGELILSLLASFAQGESVSISENVRWGIMKKFEKGIPCGRKRLLGYRWQDDELIAIPEEARLIRRIFDEYLGGRSFYAIADGLNKDGYTTITGRAFRGDGIKDILENLTYTGDLHLQKCYIEDPITKHVVRHQTDRPSYLIENHHKALVNKKDFSLAQEIIKKNSIKGARTHTFDCFTGKIICGICGKTYTHTNGKFWDCSVKKRRGGRCASKPVPEKVLRRLAAEVLRTDEFNEYLFKNKIDHIVITGAREVSFIFKSGKTVVCTWKRNER